MSKSKKHKHKSGHDHVPGESSEVVLFEEEPYDRKMEQCVEHFYHELTGIRTGRASPSLLESIQVAAYGERTGLSHVATVTARGPRVLAVAVYDSNLAPAVVQAIRDSPLGLNPSHEGTDIVVPVPEMSEDTRTAMVRLAHQEAEGARVTVRNIRQRAMADLKKRGISSEDDRKRIEKVIDDMTKRHIMEIDSALARKEKELRP